MTTPLNNGAAYLPHAGEGSVPQWNGTYAATVVNNHDPLGVGRLQLNVPQVLGNAVSTWAVPAGSYYSIPNKGTTVSCVFLGGDPAKPAWSGPLDLAPLVVSAAPPTVTYSATAPSSPRVGDVWYPIIGGTNQGPPEVWTFNSGTSTYSWVVQPGIGATAIAAGTVVAGIVDATTIHGATFVGTNWVENQYGLFLYSGTPAANNLIMSVANAAGNDATWTSGLGNDYLTGTTSYAYSATTFTSTALQHNSIGVVWYASSAPGNLRGWTAGADMYYTNSGAQTGLIIDTTAAVSNLMNINTTTATYSGTVHAANFTGGGSGTLITADSTWHTPGSLPTGWTGTLQYRLLADGTVMVVCQCSVSTSAGTGTITLFSGMDAAHTASVNTRGSCGYFVNGAPTVAQLATINSMRWSANTAGTITIQGFPGGASGSGVTEIDFCAVYPVI